MRVRTLIPVTDLGLFLSLGLLAGCATQARLVFDKPGVTDADRQRDQKECGLASADDTDSSHLLLVYGIDRDAYVSCMTARGYTVMRGSTKASR